MSNIKETAADVVESVKGFVDRRLAPMMESIRGIAGRLDRHFATLEALEKRIAALERRAGPKAAPVILDRARDR